MPQNQCSLLSLWLSLSLTLWLWLWLASSSSSAAASSPSSSSWRSLSLLFVVVVCAGVPKELPNTLVLGPRETQKLYFALVESVDFCSSENAWYFRCFLLIWVQKLRQQSIVICKYLDCVLSLAVLGKNAPHKTPQIRTNSSFAAFSEYNINMPKPQ